MRAGSDFPITVPFVMDSEPDGDPARAVAGATDSVFSTEWSDVSSREKQQVSALDLEAIGASSIRRQLESCGAAAEERPHRSRRSSR
jgi:hypothetical protein